MATIRKRIGKKKGKQGRSVNSVSWQATVRKGDHPPQYKSFKTKAEAETWATSVEDAINKDEFTPNPESKRRTLRDMLERYRKSELPKKKSQSDIGRHLDFWIEQLGDFKIAAVSRAQIVEIRDELAEGRAPGTVNRYLATLRHAFRIAETDWEWATRNPMHRIMLKEPRGRDRHLNDEEIAALLEAARDSKHPHLHAIVLIALTTGARAGEIQRLKWSDVSLKAGRATLHETKNMDKRSLVLIPKVIDQLRALQKVRRIDDNLVFTNPNYDTRKYSSIQVAWDIARENAGLKDFRFHDLRHTFASRMAMDGRSLREIAEALGHRTLAMVQRYSHLTESHVHAAVRETALRMLRDE